jgi:hypothetical protein
VRIWFRVRFRAQRLARTLREQQREMRKMISKGMGSAGMAVGYEVEDFDTGKVMVSAGEFYSKDRV